MNNTGPVASTAGPLFITQDSPVGVNPLLVSLTGEAPSAIRATDPFAAALDGIKAWQTTLGMAEPEAPAGADESPWFTRTGVIVLAVVLIGLGVYVAVK